MLVVAGFIKDGADAIVGAGCLREVAAFVGIVAADVIENADAEPVADTEGPVAGVVFVVPGAINQRSQSAGPTVTIRTVAAPTASPTLRVVGVDLSLRMVVATIGYAGERFGRVVIVTCVVDQYTDAASDAACALTVTKEIVVVVPFTIDQHAHTEIAATLTGDCQVIIILAGKIAHNAGAEDADTL